MRVAAISALRHAAFLGAVFQQPVETGNPF